MNRETLCKEGEKWSHFAENKPPKYNEANS